MGYFTNIGRNNRDVEIAQPKSLISRAFPTNTHQIKKKSLLQSFERNGSIKKLNNCETDSTNLASGTSSFRGKVNRFYSIFEKKTAKSLTSRSQKPLPRSKLSVTEFAPNLRSSSLFDWIYLPGTEDRVVIYFTSLRGIRRTFIDCSYVLMILRAFRIELDERDISMHVAYRTELSKVLGKNSGTLPQVFIKGKYIGGAEMMRQLHETGELAKMLKGVPIRTSLKACVECGDIRFIPCLNCNGSRKVFDEDEEKVNRCPDCNENGLMQCPICSVGWSNNCVGTSIDFSL